MYGANKETNYDGLNIPTLLPGKYTGFKLTGVKKTKTTKADGSEGTNILTFTFSNPEGQAHQHTEYESTEESKAANTEKRVGHILKTLGVAEATIKSNNATDFESYGAWLMGVLSANQGVKQVAVDLIIVGNVYNNKATSGFPLYVPFMSKSGQPLSFNNNQLRDNSEYFNFTANQNKPDVEGGSTQTSSSPSQAAGKPAIESDF